MLTSDAGPRVTRVPLTTHATDHSRTFQVPLPKPLEPSAGQPESINHGSPRGQPTTRTHPDRGGRGSAREPYLESDVHRRETEGVVGSGRVDFGRPRDTAVRYPLTLEGLKTCPWRRVTGGLQMDDLPSGTRSPSPMTTLPRTGCDLVVTVVETPGPLSCARGNVGRGVGDHPGQKMTPLLPVPFDSGRLASGRGSTGVGPGTKESEGGSRAPDKGPPLETPSTSTFDAGPVAPGEGRDTSLHPSPRLTSLVFDTSPKPLPPMTSTTGGR